MRRIASIRDQLLLGLAVWLGTALTLNMMGIGLTRFAHIGETGCQVRLDAPSAVPMRTAEVLRTTLDRWSEIAMREGRIVPEVRDDRMIGFRVWSVHPGGVIAAAGLRDGDLITAINGYDLSSPDKALRAYASLRSVTHYTVDIERGGRRITLVDPVPSCVLGGGCDLE